MTLNLGIIDLLKLLGKLIAHKYQQVRFATNEYEIVDTSYGKIKGIKRKTLYDEEDTYYAFEGVPYAKPPLGELRFRAPEPPEPWEGILDCTTFKAMPMQVHFVRKLIEGSENCLHVNIYIKTLNSSRPLPVMIWIYGGGYQFGEASRDVYAPDYFMQRDVILITFNYRLGPLGFLSFNDPDLQIPGNAGLKDQVMVLKWVKENIHNFNGDPHNVTIFGESAGGASVNYLMMYPRAKGLFHKAILQSGVALCSWTNTPPCDWGYRLACHIGYKGSNNDKEVYRYLAKQSASRLILRDCKPLTKQDLMDQHMFAFCPVVEPYDSEDCIINKPIKEYLRTGWGNDIPIIIGGNSFEGLFHHSIVGKFPFLVDEITDCVNMLPIDMQVRHTDQELQEMARKLKAMHFGDRKPDLKGYMDMTSYRMFWHGIHRTMKARQAYAPHTPTYCYVFDFDSKFFNHFRILNCGPDYRGTCHADDTSYLFYNLAAEKLSKTTPEYQCIQRMVGMWYNFALSSNPNCKEIEPTKWEPISDLVDEGKPIKCLNISENVEVKDLPFHEKLRIWDSFYTKEFLY